MPLAQYPLAISDICTGGRARYDHGPEHLILLLVAEQIADPGLMRGNAGRVGLCHTRQYIKLPARLGERFSPPVDMAIGDMVEVPLNPIG